MSTTYEKCVREKVKFEYYSDGNLYYKCENNLRFKVPIDEINPNVVVLAEEQGINFSVWIARALNTN